MFNPYLRLPNQLEFLQRSVIENEIERLIALLDMLDGDPDCYDISDYEAEPDDEDEPDDELNGDDEPWLGWITTSEGRTCCSGTNDLEAGAS